jgi:acetyl esterase/lipase
MKTILSLLLFMNVATTCQQNETAFAKEKSLPQQNFPNVPYGKDPLQTIDIYLPEGRSSSNTKSLILIHGGGWNSGSKADFATYIDSFKHRLPDYAIFNIGYRLVSGGNLFPTQENDVKTAVDFITANAEKYGVSIEGFVLLGVSAGAHLALLQAYKYNFPKVRAVVDYFGPADLVTMYQKPWHPLVPLALQMVTGTTPDKSKTLFEEWSPVNHITPASPPTLILHGGKDQVVDVSQSKLLAKKLAGAAVKHNLEIYPAERHGRWYGTALTASFDRIESFLKENVQ